MSHLSYEGQPAVDYCIECSLKHSQTAKVLIREGLQRAEVCNCTNSEGVLEKVRGVVEELSGAEDDTNTIQNQDIIDLNTEIRELRKFIYSSKAEIGGASIDVLREIKDKVDSFVERVYAVREKVDCPTCKIPRVREIEPKAQEPNLEEYGRSVSEKRKQFMEEIMTETS